MPLLRVLGALLAALVAAASLAVWLLPSLLDLDRYRGEIAALAGARLSRLAHVDGLSVSIDGHVAMTIFPPTLTATHIRLTAPPAPPGDPAQPAAPPTAGASLAAEALRLDVGLAPLLAGRIEARALVLSGAVLQLPAPVASWPLGTAAPTPDRPGRLLDALPALSARVEDGRLQVGELAITGIEATLATPETSGFGAGAVAAGGTSITGSGEVGGRRWRFTTRLGRAGGDGTATLDATLDGLGAAQGLGAMFAGQLAADGSLAGHLVAGGPDLSQLIAAPPVSFKLAGKLTAAGGLVASDSLDLDIGGSPGRASLALRTVPEPRLELVVAASRLDLDDWLPPLLHAPPGGPGGLATNFDLSAEAAQLGGGTVRALRGAFDLERDAVQVHEFGMVLPGDAPLHLSGRLTRQPAPADPHFASPHFASPHFASPHFEGQVALRAPAPRTTLAWLSSTGLSSTGLAGGIALPEGVLRQAGLSGTLVVDPGQLALGELDATIDGAHLTGSLTWRSRPRPGLGAGLVLDRLDLDPWLGTVTGGAASAGSERPDADLRLDIARVFLAGEPLGRLSLDATATPGRVSLRKLELQHETVRATASGTLDAAGLLTDGQLDISASVAAPLARLADRVAGGALARRFGGVSPGPCPGRSGWAGEPAALRVQAAGPRRAMALRVIADLGDLRVESQPVLDVTTGAWGGPIALRHPGVGRLAQTGCLDAIAAWLGDGSLGVVGDLAGDPGGVRAEHLRISAGSLHGLGTLAADRSGGVTGRLELDALPLPRWPLSPGDPDVDARLWIPPPGWRVTLDLTAAQLLAGRTAWMHDAKGHLDIADGRARLDVAGGVGDGSVSGVLGWEAAEPAPRLTLTATLRDADVPGRAEVGDDGFALVAGRISGEATLSATGHAPAALLATLGGRLHAVVEDGAMAGWDLAGVARRPGELSGAALRRGITAFSRLQLAGSVSGGLLQVDAASLLAAFGAATATGALDLSEAATDLLVTLSPTGGAAVGIRVTGALADLKRRIDAVEHAEGEAPEQQYDGKL